MLTNKTDAKHGAESIMNDPVPALGTPGSTAQKSMASLPRVLLIAFHFPPEAVSSGIQRTLSFFKNLGKYGWEPMVLSAHPR
ncbi:MAG TPA: hypothetical protein VF797_10595, partial [Noviherbaspirillum sp.]